MASASSVFQRRPHLYPFPTWPDAVLSDVFSSLDLLAGTCKHRAIEGRGEKLIINRSIDMIDITYISITSKSDKEANRESAKKLQFVRWPLEGGSS